MKSQMARQNTTLTWNFFWSLRGGVQAAICARRSFSAGEERKDVGRATGPAGAQVPEQGSAGVTLI